MTNLSAEADYLIISHAKLMSSAKEYEEYRKSAAGGAFKTKLVDIEQIYYQFGYGQLSWPWNQATWAQVCNPHP